MCSFLLSITLLTSLLTKTGDPCPHIQLITAVTVFPVFHHCLTDYSIVKSVVLSCTRCIRQKINLVAPRRVIISLLPITRFYLTSVRSFFSLNFLCKVQYALEYKKQHDNKSQYAAQYHFHVKNIRPA